VERRTGEVVRAVHGVGDEHATVRGGARSWRLRVRAEARPEQVGEVAEAVRAELDRLSLPPAVPVEVSLHSSRRTS
jgi:hypothetical protein